MAVTATPFTGGGRLDLGYLGVPGCTVRSALYLGRCLIHHFQFVCCWATVGGGCYASFINEPASYGLHSVGLATSIGTRHR